MLVVATSGLEMPNIALRAFDAATLHAILFEAAASVAFHRGAAEAFANEAPTLLAFIAGGLMQQDGGARPCSWEGGCWMPIGMLFTPESLLGPGAAMAAAVVNAGLQKVQE